jgi:3-methyladenine DNA glycosylase Tag
MHIPILWAKLSSIDSEKIVILFKKAVLNLLGSTVVYAYLQATGLVNDVLVIVGKKSVNNGVVFSDFSKLHT